MRAVLAAALALFVALVALAPHVHAAPNGAEECAVCVASGRGAEPARVATPELGPTEWVVTAPGSHPTPSPVLGAPLGAIPGQSPPRA